MIRRPRRSPLFPSTPLFRSGVDDALEGGEQPLSGMADRVEGTRLDQRLDGALVEHHGIDPFAEVVEVGIRRSEEHTSELQSPCNLVCRLLLEKKKTDGDLAIPAHAHIASPPHRRVAPPQAPS